MLVNPANPDHWLSIKRMVTRECRAPDDPTAALAAWEPGQLALGRNLQARTRAIGQRSLVDGTWRAGDPELIFGLYGPGE